MSWKEEFWYLSSILRDDEMQYLAQLKARQAKMHDF